MKVILTENIKNIGQRGEIIDVKDGFARNFLFPQKKARPATENNIRLIEKEKEKELQKEEKNKQESLIEKKKIEGQKIDLKVKAEKEKIFGSLSEKEIKKALEEGGIELKLGKIKLSEKIKKLGDYQIEVHWPGDIKTEFTLTVTAEK